MRIIAGAWRGRTIAAPPGDGTRPTTDRVREALFSMLTSRLGSFDGLRVADLFAGSGALGLEALSRGAAHCVFVEQDRGALRPLRTNIDTLGASADVQARSVASIRPAEAPYDLIFLDPPYGQGLTEPTLASLIDRNWCGQGSWISIETEPDLELAVDGLALESAKRFGKTQIHLFSVI